MFVMQLLSEIAFNLFPKCSPLYANIDSSHQSLRPCVVSSLKDDNNIEEEKRLVKWKQSSIFTFLIKFIDWSLRISSKAPYELQREESSSSDAVPSKKTESSKSWLGVTSFKPNNWAASSSIHPWPHHLLWFFFFFIPSVNVMWFRWG